jgi:predicted ester cyclase
VSGVEDDATSLPDRARAAITLVCSGDLARVGDYYHPRFVDHVNEMTFHGLDGARESVSFYRQLFPDLRFEIEDQVAQADRVASRFALHGTYRGRTVVLRGITISRFEDARIIEDWGYTDALSLLRQLGVGGTARLALDLATRRVRLPAGALGGSRR